MIAPRKKIAILFVLTALGEAAWLAAIVAAPYLRSRNAPLSRFLYMCFAPLCHQRPERSFTAFGYPLAVCARCLGIYLGAGFGLCLYPLARGWETLRLPATRTFVLLSAPIVFDTAANVLGVWNSGNVLRLATGLLWGPLLPFFFLTGVGELLTRPAKRAEKRPPPTPSASTKNRAF